MSRVLATPVGTRQPARLEHPSSLSTDSLDFIAFRGNNGQGICHVINLSSNLFLNEYNFDKEGYFIVSRNLIYEIN